MQNKKYIEHMQSLEYTDYGYCRISTKRQSLERQERNIKEKYPDAHIVKEIFTGARIQGRKEWDKLYKLVLKEAKAGKRVRIIFDSVSRFSRNADEGCQLYEELFNQGIELVFLKEPHINTETYKKLIQNKIDVSINTGDKPTDEFISSIIADLNKYTLDLAKTQIRLVFEQAEKELQDLHQRTSEGMKTAKLNGKQIGRVQGRRYVTHKELEAKEVIMRLSKDFNGYNSDEEVMKIAGICRNSYYKYKKELRVQMITPDEI